MRRNTGNAGNTQARQKPVAENVTVESASSLCYHTHCSDGAHCAVKFGSSSERLVIFVKGETYLRGNGTAFFQPVAFSRMRFPSGIPVASDENHTGERPFVKNKKRRKMMKRLFMTSLALCAATALAMPEKKELVKTQPLVNELMSSVVDDYKAKKKTAKEVAETAEKFANEAEGEAAKFLLLKGAVTYYSRAAEYDKAADMVEAIKADVKDVPPEVLSEIISKATLRISSKNAPRLYALYKAARAQVKAQKELKTLEAALKKRPGNLVARREYAETLAVSGDWQKALQEFAQLKDTAAAMAKAELDGKAKSAELAEFWWSYKTQSEEVDDALKARAAMYYKKAIDAEELSGLKKTLAEQRIAEVGTALVAADMEQEFNKRLYCVIDISAGHKADKYPVSYIAEPPKQGWSTADKTTKIVLRRIKAGADPLKRYSISKDYYVAIFETTQKQWELVMGSVPEQKHITADASPVAMVSYMDVCGTDGFIGKLSAKANVGIFDLPTEAQWEYACRAGATSEYAATKGLQKEVGMMPPNTWGLYDMLGSIWERCKDFGSAMKGKDPVGDISGMRSANCGCCGYQGRAGSNLANAFDDRGFRIILQVK